MGKKLALAAVLGLGAVVVVAGVLWRDMAFECLGSRDPVYRGRSFSAWVKTAHDPGSRAQAVPAITDALNAWKMSVRLGAAEALGAMGPEAGSEWASRSFLSAGPLR